MVLHSLGAMNISWAVIDWALVLWQLCSLQFSPSCDTFFCFRLLLFVDEADAFLRKRSTVSGAASVQNERIACRQQNRIHPLGFSLSSMLLWTMTYFFISMFMMFCIIMFIIYMLLYNYVYHTYVYHTYVYDVLHIYVYHIHVIDVLHIYVYDVSSYLCLWCSSHSF